MTWFHWFPRSVWERKGATLRVALSREYLDGLLPQSGRNVRSHPERGNEYGILIVKILLSAVALVVCLPAAISQDKKDLAQYEKEMAERPLEAMSIARRATVPFPDDEKQLYRWAAEHQERHLADLSLAQALELAEVLEKKLLDSQAGRRIRFGWIQARSAGLNQEEVRRLLGSPQRNSFQVVYFRQIEQWIYDQPVPARLSFSCTKGQTPRLDTVHSSK